MNLKNQIVIYSALGEGTIVEQKEKYLVISFASGRKMFPFPDAFPTYLTAKDPAIAAEIEMLLKEQAESKLQAQLASERMQEMKLQAMREVAAQPAKSRAKKQERVNIAFKCNFCDGGQSSEQVGFNGICSDEQISKNITVEKRPWCTNAECPCSQYHNQEITRAELDDVQKDGGFACYESQILRDWKASAGTILQGVNSGKSKKLKQVQTNSLCVLTSREANMPEGSRFIFAVFLVDETYEGDEQDPGFVGTSSPYRLMLSPDEAKHLLYWNYYVNAGKPATPSWGTGLHRYLDDEQAAQILRDLVEIKKGAADEQLANEFYDYFCQANNFDTSAIGPLRGALHLKK